MSPLSNALRRRRYKVPERSLDIDQIEVGPIMSDQEEREFSEERWTEGPEEYAPTSVRLPLPEYVTQLEGVSREGQLTAQVVAAEFEKAAKEIEEMGHELVANSKKLEEAYVKASTGMAEALRDVVETAAAYREAGKLLHLKIQNHSLLIQEVKEHCKQMRDKISYDHSNPEPSSETEQA